VLNFTPVGAGVGYGTLKTQNLKFHNINALCNCYKILLSIPCHVRFMFKIRLDSLKGSKVMAIQPPERIIPRNFQHLT